MFRFPIGKLHNTYIIETSDIASTKKSVLDFAVSNGFDKGLVYTNNHPDIICIESKEDKFAMNDLREMIFDSIYYSPKVCDKKFYIIYDTVYLDHNMQNAMLKTLEEPPEYDVFFLITSNANSLLDTVKSRGIFLKDNKEENYKDLLSFEFLDDAILHLSNIKYENESDKMFFADSFEKREDRFKDLIKLYRYLLRDALAYKKTLSKELIIVKEKETEIVSIANSLSYEDFGWLLDNLAELSKIKGYQINKKIAVFNFLSGGKNGEMLRNKV